MKVMFVDDDVINNEVNQMLFRKLYPEIEVVVKSSVDAAMDYLNDPEVKNPNKIFLDINLPIKSGWDFLTEYKQLEMPGTDVYMLTSALDLLDNNKREQHTEVKDFVEKPLYDYKLESILSE